VVIFYISLLVWPHPSRLNLLHDFPLSYSLLDPPSTLLAIVAITGLLATALWIAKKDRVVAFLILWFFGHLVLESSIIPLEIIYEHRTYLPSIAAVLLLVVLVSRLRPPRWLAVSAVCLLAATWSTWTYQRNMLWTDPVAFWVDSIKKAPATVRPYNNLGVELMKAHRDDEAYEAYSRAIAVHDEYLRTRQARLQHTGSSTLDWIQATAYYNRGTILQARGDLLAAKRDFDKAIQLTPGHRHIVYLNRGIVEQRLGNYQAAIDDYTKAIFLESEAYEAYSNRGQVKMILGRHDEAMIDLNIAIRINPRYATAYGRRGNLWRMLGRHRKALEDYNRVIELNPDDPLAYANLGATLEALGDADGAKQAYRDAIGLSSPNWPERARVSRLLRNLQNKSRHIPGQP
jgi:tetratricopeptide (TPR) repeat protein